ncbi:hypothetical protein COCOBI_18-0490 [Coccomyxa sp. Obi]|nr:hypothetical protein COCOBI_18-0490 [Coccomyxa sp. Obi]
MFHDAITNAPDGAAAVYQTNRLGGSFGYSFGPADGLVASRNYTVTLLFCELYFDSASQRLFSVTTNQNQSLLSSFDVFSVAGGKDVPVSETFRVAADATGTLSLQFAALVNNAILAGIHISEDTPAGVFSPTLPGVPPVAGATVLPPAGAPAPTGPPPAAEPPRAPGALPPLPGASPPVPGPAHAAGGPTQSPNQAPIQSPNQALIPSPGAAISQAPHQYSTVPAPPETLVPPSPSLDTTPPALAPADSSATSPPTPIATLQPSSPPSSPTPIVAQGTPVQATGTSAQSSQVLWISKGQLAGIVLGIFFGLLIILLILIAILALMFLKYLRRREAELAAKHNRSVHTVIIDAQA